MLDTRDITYTASVLKESVCRARERGECCQSVWLRLLLKEHEVKPLILPGEGSRTGSRGIGWAAGEAKAQTDVAHSGTPREETWLEPRVREAF